VACRPGDSRFGLLKVVPPPVLRIRTLAVGPASEILNPFPMALDSDKAYEALFEIGAQIQAMEVDLAGVLQLIVEKARSLVRADIAWLALYETEHDTLSVVTTSGSQTPAFKSMSVQVGRGVGGAALARRETLVVPQYAEYLQDTPDAVRYAVTGEGIQSVVCAPMVRDERMVGALYVGNRAATEFGGDAASLVTALAGQASIAIENSRLLHALEASNRLLEQSEATHRQLTDAALAQTGVDGVSETLALLLQRRITITQEIAPPFVRSFLAHGSPDDPEVIAATVPIVAADEELGTIAVAGDSLDALGIRALEHGATVLAVELLKERSRRDVEWRLGGELLHELLERSEPVDRRLAARAARLGIDLKVAHRVVVVESNTSEIDQRAVRNVIAAVLGPHARGALLSSFGPQRLVVVAPSGVGGELPEEALTSMAEVATADRSCVVGVSRLCVDLPSGLREALGCAKFALFSGRSSAVVRADDLGAMRFLFAIEDPRPLHEYVNEQLGALYEHEGSHGSQLVSTLRAYLEADGHHATIAEKCHIHKSTVKYRLGRLRDVLGRSLGDPDVRFELRLAFALADTLEAIGLPLPER
jgi:DNA-binding PucR family transcriptional regulator/putative methionine-R-sulfoxide reductase with GAF domain